MKKFFKGIFYLFLVVVILPTLILGGLLFVRPLLFFNPENLAWVLNKTKIFETWSWKKSYISHERLSWGDRRLTGEFKDFCFKLNKQAIKMDTCLEEISWDFNLLLGWTHIPRAKTNHPFKVRSSFTNITSGKEEKKEESGLPDVWGYWKILWADYIPDIDFSFQKISIHNEEDSEKPMIFDIALIKTEKKLKISALEFDLQADPDKIIVMAPKRYPFPKDLGTTRPVYFKDLKLTALMKEEGIPLELTGFLESIEVTAKSYVDLPLKDDFPGEKFRKDALLKSSAVIALRGLKETLRDYSPAPYNELPTPLNSMNGDIILGIETEKASGANIGIKGDLAIDLKSKSQTVNLNILGNVPLNVMNFSRGALNLVIDLHRLNFALPKLSKKELPPQFAPDSRFKKHKDINAEKKPGPPINFHLLATEKHSLNIKSNLLDEPLRLEMDLHVKNGLKEGKVHILPLKTTVFKRPIKVEKMVIDFNDPLPAVVEGQIKFPLPEYLITMNFEGPTTSPRYAFQSDPPLPESDIYAVLLFGRPMSDLGTEDKASAGRTSQVLSNGLLTLSALYFLAGSPVEYVGYDPDSKNATAQIGVGKKSSLRVSGGGEGVNSTALRRSLGKGWYIDTSVQENTSGDVSSDSRDYGVLLERIMAY